MPKYIIIFLLFYSWSLTSQSGATLSIDLGVKNQRIYVAKSSFETELTYPADAETQLVQLINNGFATLDSLIRKGEKQWCAADGSCFPFDEFLTAYLAFTKAEGVGIDVTDAFFDYIDNLDDPDEIELSVFDLFTEYLFRILQQTALYGAPIDLSDTESADNDYDSLSFLFPIKPPIDVAKTTVLWLGKDTLDEETKNRVLKGLDGQLFFNQKISDQMANYFALLNFKPDYFIQPGEIKILPSRVARFRVITKKVKDVDQIAYLLLPHKLYKAFLKIPKDSIKFEGLSGGFQYQFDLLSYFDKEIEQLPILSTSDLAQVQTKLVQHRYSLNASPTPNALLDDFVEIEEQQLFIDLVANQLETDKDSTNITPATPNVADGNNLSNTPAADFDPSNKEFKPKGLTKFNRNFLGFGADYNINDETRIKAVFERLLQDGSNLSIQLAFAFNEKGLENAGLALSGSYAKDYLFFNKLKKRLGVQLSAGSAYTSNRVFSGIPVKERRTGAKMRTEIDWYRDRMNRLFRSHLEVDNEKVNLQNFDDQELNNATIFSTEWGNVFFITSPVNKLLGTRFKLKNTLKFGWADSDQSINFFSTGAINLDLNQKLLKGMAIDLSAYTQWNSSKTPFFEQIGHRVPRNRGFKQDAVIGRSLLGASLEFQSPLPKFGNKNSGLNKYFYQHVRLAIFNDFSRYNQLFGSDITFDSINMWSPGMGIRLIMGIAQVNFDWALRRSQIATLNGGSQFSLNLVLNSPFQ